jgi:hypothetical protein
LALGVGSKFKSKNCKKKNKKEWPNVLVGKVED